MGYIAGSFAFLPVEFVEIREIASKEFLIKLSAYRQSLLERPLAALGMDLRRKIGRKGGELKDGKGKGGYFLPI